MSKKKIKKSRGLEDGLPAGFPERLKEIIGESAFAQVVKTFATRPTTFRINTLRAKPEEVLPILRSAGLKFERAVLPGAFVLDLRHKKRELTDLPIYAEGKIYIQSLASMVPPLILDPKPGEKILDLTAAPGSKTSQIAALMGGVGELVANDNNEVRFYKLKHNMELLGVTTEREGWSFKIFREHGAKLAQRFPNYFDKILLDAPCSAEARFNVNDPTTFGYWKERKIKEMAYKQRQLLLSAWGALRPGGILVYSTCTFAPEENEIQVARLLQRAPEAVLEKIALKDVVFLGGIASWRDREIAPNVSLSARIRPTSEIEGFYLAKLRKKNGLSF